MSDDRRYAVVRELYKENEKDLAAEKKTLRQGLKQKRKNLPESYRHQADRQILECVKSLELYRQAHRIFCYVSMAEEVDTRLLLEKMLAEGKIVAVRAVS